MFPYYITIPPTVRPLHLQFQPLSVLESTSSDTHALPVSHNQIPPVIDKVIRQKYAQSNKNFCTVISRSRLNAENKQHCLSLVQRLRIYKHLFVHTYEHLVGCCNGRYLDWLANYADNLGGWDCVQQLARHSIIRETLLSFGTGCVCRRHESTFVERSAIGDDDNDLLCLLLYCCRGKELYGLATKPAIRGFNNAVCKESEEIIELLWKFLMKRGEKTDVARRLRASVYRMARKCAYLPRDFQIDRSSITSERRSPFPQGAFGAIRLARMDGNGVIIKRIYYNGRDPRDCLQMFSSEAILWGSLQHKNIVPFLGVILEGSGLGLVSPFLQNGSIRRYMQAHNQEDWPILTKRLGRGIAKALDYIHSHEPPIIHGDLKADNVLIDDDGHACLADFGQSYSSDSGRYFDSGRVGRPCSPLRWTAPELLTGGRHVKITDKSDMYAFGCLLYEMISGQFPFYRVPTDDGVAMCVLRGERPNRPSSIDRNDVVWKAIEACWMHRPGDRASAKHITSLLR